MVYGPLAGRRFDGHSVPGLREMGREHGCRLYCHASEREAIAKQCDLDVSELSPLRHGSSVDVGAAAVLQVLHTPGHSSGSICLVACEEEGGEPTKRAAPSPVTFTPVRLPPSAASSMATPPVVVPSPPRAASPPGTHAPQDGRSEPLTVETEGASGRASMRSVGGSKFVLVGDTIFPGACGRLDLPGCDAAAMYDSLRTLRALDAVLPVYPGHSFLGECTTIGRERDEGMLRVLDKAAWLCMHERAEALPEGDGEGEKAPAASKTPFFMPPMEEQSAA